MSAQKVWLAWSSGKDSAWTLHELRASPEFEVTALLTTINSDAGRVAMHAVRQTLLESQAEALGLPLVKVPIPGGWPSVSTAAGGPGGRHTRKSPKRVGWRVGTHVKS